jgi:SAM-dependent methyltransferase
MLLSIRQITHRLYLAVRQQGIMGAVRQATLAGARTLSLRRDPFDQEFDTETSRQESLWVLGIKNPNVEHGVKYQPTPASTFAAGLECIPEDLSKFVFVDLGCGKGRTLIMADRAGFRYTLGVEFSAKLAGTALQNCAKVGTKHAGVVVGDAAEFAFPLEPLVVFFYNPFRPPVLEPVLHNLLSSLADHPRPAYIFYVDPLHREVVEHAGNFRVIGEAGDPAFLIWRYEHASRTASR